MGRLLVDTIVVPESYFDSDVTFELMEANEAFIVAICRDGRYEESELLPDCIMLRKIYDYVGQVCNGGHEQYISNRGWKHQVNDIVEHGLSRIGAIQFATLFSDIRAYVDIDPVERESIRRRGGFDDLGNCGPVDRGIRAFDNHFF